MVASEFSEWICYGGVVYERLQFPLIHKNENWKRKPASPLKAYGYSGGFCQSVAATLE
jgi:hypothetical protein